MSRTIRRKRATHEYDWVLRDFQRLGRGHFVMIRMDARTAEARRRLAKFHSDAQTTMQMVPASFRRGRNRLYRNQVEQEIRVFAKVGELEDGPLLRSPKCRKDAAWHWW